MPDNKFKECVVHQPLNLGSRVQMSSRVVVLFENIYFDLLK